MSNPLHPLRQTTYSYRIYWSIGLATLLLIILGLGPVNAAGEFTPTSDDLQTPTPLEWTGQDTAAVTTPTPLTTPIFTETQTLTPLIVPSTPTPTVDHTGFPTTTLKALTPLPPTPDTIVSSLDITDTGSTIFLPFVFQNPAPSPTPPPYTPSVKRLYCDAFSSPRSIPDYNSTGIDDTITVNNTELMIDVDVYVNINHTWVGDLNVKLTHEDVDESVNLIHRPGREGSGLGCSQDNIRTILDDEITSAVENKCAASPSAISGIYTPNQPLSWLDGVSVAGRWTLNVSDNSSTATGTLRGWCMLATVSENPEPPTPTPTPPSVPASSIISGVTGGYQSLPLDCETRSAVDWANYFGVDIDELDFFHLLPHSDNPDVGFVGSVYGAWGQTPPGPYGVHAEPVAEVLRDHGLDAYTHRPLSWTDLRAEIAANRPVMVWIIGSIINGHPEYYTPSDGLHTIVAPYEHTVIVTGYTNSSVYYLNGDTIYTRSVNQFLDSWSALGNMAITARP